MVLCGSLLWTEAALAAQRVLILEVVINGRRAGRVSEFVERDGALYFHADDLKSFGLAVPPDLPAGAGLTPFSALPALSVQIDESQQTLLIAAGGSALQTTQLGAAPPARLTPLTKAQFGALLNYDSAVTYADNRASGGALLDLRLFGPYGVVESSALVSIDPPRGQSKVVRLDTTFTVTQPDKLRRWRVGDVVTGALPWTRAVRLGGAQVASDFGLRPDLITFPLPTISASAAVPSTVNVMVNGVRQLSDTVEPGPFAISSLPVVSGAGTVSVTLRDALGQPTLITLPFYASSALLRPGLTSYSLEVGAVRKDYGLSGDHYAGWAVNQSSRFGLTDWLTLESHAEATSGTAVAGAGAALLVGTFGIANLAIAGSTGGGATGALVAAGFQRVAERLNFGFSGTYATRHYRDIAALHGAPVPKATLDASLGYQLGRWGSLGLAYNRRIARPEQAADEPLREAPSIELITGSYNVLLANFANFHATGFTDLRDKAVYGFGAGLSFPLGRAGHASLGASLDRGGLTRSADLVRSVQRSGDFGYRLRVADGAAPQRSAVGEYLAPWGHVSAGVEHFSGQLAARAGARGALVLAGGELFASEQIGDSFAVVDTGGVAGIPVMVENRFVGRSNKRGKLLIPSLRSFQDNRLSVDSTLLPADVEIAATNLVVRPADRSGVAVDFGVRKVRAALITLHDRLGRAIALGSVARIAGEGDQPIGHDGAAYVTGLKPSNRVEVALPDGTHCAANFDYRPVSGDIPLIGPLPCR